MAATPDNAGEGLGGERRGGGELHQQAEGAQPKLTTNQGVVVSDDQNSLRVGPRGPLLIEDIHFREKIMHFDHERIPERVVHARGFGAHGYFEPVGDHSAVTKAAFLQSGAGRTPVFCRFSTVAGSKGSADTVRDVRGFAVKFYTTEGIYDLVGNNIPVFFIQDALKFPDFVHSVKPAPDRGFPQAQSAHDNFWDFVSLNPESMHMLMWVMSDRAIPRSFRMMEGFGVHTFRFVNRQGESTFVKFHWRPALRSRSLIWKEAQRIAGVDPDFHRRDLWNAIERGDFPEWVLYGQLFSQSDADSFAFDILDPTKLIPEEKVPLTPLGKMVLNQNVANFFSETEQVAFCPSHIPPGIDLSNDPLLQGRLFSYLDTQLSRLGGPNFHQIPVNASRSPVANFQRDGHMQMEVFKGRLAHEPNTLEPQGPRESAQAGFGTFPSKESGEKVRIRPESFADHYSQATMFWTSMSPAEQAHIVNAFSFELGKCHSQQIRLRMVQHLHQVDKELAEKVGQSLGMEAQALPQREESNRSKTAISKALPLYPEDASDFTGFNVGVLTTQGVDAKFLSELLEAGKSRKVTAEFITPKAAATLTDNAASFSPRHFLTGSPSALFDCVIVAPSHEGSAELAKQKDAIEWIREAYAHLKVIGYLPDGRFLLERAGIALNADEGVIPLNEKPLEHFFTVAAKHRIWKRELQG